MQDIGEYITEQLQRFRNGDASGVFFNLLELDSSATAHLVRSFQSEKDADCRELIVEVIWQRRDPQAIPFLSESLNDPDPLVWQQAIDGLVAFGSPDALAVLREARKRQSSNSDQAIVFREWIDEAIDQVEKRVRTA
jgi:HEAT repeat protein